MKKTEHEEPTFEDDGPLEGVGDCVGMVEPDLLRSYDGVTLISEDVPRCTI